MKSVENYSYQVNLHEGNSASFILEMVGKNKRVIEVGAGPGSVTKLLINESGCKVDAIEIDDASIEILKTICNSVYKVNLNDDWLKQFDQTKNYDVVVAADVLEHLNNPLHTLTDLKKLLNTEGEIIVSLPHIGHAVIYACLMDNDFEYRDYGLLDRTHIRFFSIKNIQQLFSAAGLKIVDAKFVVRRPEYTEYAHKWANTSADFRKVIEKNKFSHVYQVVVKAVPDSLPIQSIDLLSTPVQEAPFSIVREINRLLLLYTPSKVYTFIRETYRRWFL